MCDTSPLMDKNSSIVIDLLKIISLKFKPFVGFILESHASKQSVNSKVLQLVAKKTFRNKTGQQLKNFDEYKKNYKQLFNDNSNVRIDH